MRSEFARDKDDPDTIVKGAAAERPGKTIRLRIQPSIFRLREGKTSSSGHYVAWPSISWKIECESVEEVLAFRDGLRAFLKMTEEHGPAAVTKALQKTTWKEDAA